MRTTKDILRDIELNRIGFAHASGARRMSYSEEHRELKKELNQPRVIEVRPIGRVFHVRFASWQKIFTAQVYKGTVRSLHRVTQQAGGHAVGGSIDKFTSISKNHPDYASWSAIAVQFAQEQS